MCKKEHARTSGLERRIRLDRNRGTYGTRSARDTKGTHKLQTMYNFHTVSEESRRHAVTSKKRSNLYEHLVFKHKNEKN